MDIVKTNGGKDFFEFADFRLDPGRHRCCGKTNLSAPAEGIRYASWWSKATGWYRRMS
jgi:hypothetical protein